MAVTTTTFNPEMWSDMIMKSFKDQVIFGGKPQRSKGAQLLRDAALGHPEYPPDPRSPPPSLNKTATQVRIQNEYAEHAAKALAYSVDNSIITSLINVTSNATKK